METLEDAMSKVRKFLEKHGVSGWAKRLLQYEEAIRRLAPSDIHGWQYFLRNLHIVGGMGALDDLVICKANGFVVDDERKVNAEYMDLVTNLADALARYEALYGVR
jgi:hypothetical protein